MPMLGEMFALPAYIVVAHIGARIYVKMDEAIFDKKIKHGERGGYIWWNGMVGTCLP